MELAYLLAGALLLGVGCYLGWTARDKAGYVRGESTVELVDKPVGDPVVVPVWGVPDDDGE